MLSSRLTIAALTLALCSSADAESSTTDGPAGGVGRPAS